MISKSSTELRQEGLEELRVRENKYPIRGLRLVGRN